MDSMFFVPLSHMNPPPFSLPIIKLLLLIIITII